MSDPYGTHKEFLNKLLELNNEDNLPILELGSGYGSTPILHKHCTENSIRLKTLDNNLSWLSKMQGEYAENEYHQYTKVHNWEESLKELVNEKYFLVFVDQSPWEARTLSIELFKSISQFVMVHDCDYFPTNNIWGKVVIPMQGPLNPGKRDYSDVFNYHKEFFPKDWQAPTGPPTLIGSQFKDIEI